MGGVGGDKLKLEKTLGFKCTFTTTKKSIINISYEVDCTFTIESPPYLISQMQKDNRYKEAVCSCI